jgi:hypothetical protein
MLLFTAMISLLLGMGLPTTANYIVVSTLMAPVIVTLGAASGLVVPLIAVHMFVFYFGILADDTPPVGLAAFAAAAIARSDPIRTGIQGFTYDIRTAILPFMFIFNTQLLMIGIGNVFELVVVISSATLAMLLFAAATQGFMLVKNRIWETLALLLITFSLFRPGFFWDYLYPPLETVPATQIVEVAGQLPAGTSLRMEAAGETLEGEFVSRLVMLPLSAAEGGAERLAEAGLEVREEEGKVLVDNLAFGSPAEKLGLDFDWEIRGLQLPTDRPSKLWMVIPALVLFGLVLFSQRTRRARQAASAAA